MYSRVLGSNFGLNSPQDGFNKDNLQFSSIGFPSNLPKTSFEFIIFSSSGFIKSNFMEKLLVLALLFAKNINSKSFDLLSSSKVNSRGLFSGGENVKSNYFAVVFSTFILRLVFVSASRFL